MFNKITKTFQWGAQQVTLETGEIARHATGAVLVSIQDTVILATVVAQKNAKTGQEFFPLTVDYLEKGYAAGKIPGSFFRREGRLSEGETLVSRLIDRSIRPLFPKDLCNDVQIVVHVLSLDPNIPTDIPSIIGVSAALTISGVPFNGPVSAARVCYIDGQYVLNPTREQIDNSRLDLVIAGTENAVLMVESEADQLSEHIMLGAIEFGHEHMQFAIDAIYDLVEQGGKSEWDWKPLVHDELLIKRIIDLAEPKLQAVYKVRSKEERSIRIEKIKEEVLLKISEIEGLKIDTSEFNRTIHDLAAKIVRNQILAGLPRIDGRDTRAIRDIEIRTGILPRAHGSALFTRGDTQALVITTLGTTRDEQVIDALEGEYRERFMLHYNMPPFATGEVGRLGAPRRREIGHGRLAKRALSPCLPSSSEFGYTMRVVSEITESNGSSSMATVCGSCLALLDAGVPMKEQVAGVAMGLIFDNGKCAILTDILGDEDHLGDMDFKVAGTRNGITALQMDVKTQCVTQEIMQMALAQAKEGLMHILEKMHTSSSVRKKLSVHAPRMLTIEIPPNKIRDIIGRGGSVIRALTEETNTTIDITDEGIVTIVGISDEGMETAKRKIEQLTVVVEAGQIYEGTVVKVLDFGAIVNILPGKDGLLHISEIVNERVNNVKDYITENQLIRVKVLAADNKGRIRLSAKALLKEEALPR